MHYNQEIEEIHTNLLVHLIAEMPDAVIFDLDGTLIDSIEVFNKVLREIFRRVGLPPVSKEDVMDVMRSGLSPWDSLIPADIPNRQELVQRCITVDAEVWPRVYREEARLFPGSHQTLKFLSQKDVKIGIATSGFQILNEINQLLQDEGVDRYVGTIIMRYDTSQPKPSPDPILLCLKRLAARASSSIYVGDTPNDIRAGKAAGTRTAAVLSGVGTLESLQSLNPDWIIQGVEEIPNILLSSKK